MAFHASAADTLGNHRTARTFCVLSDENHLVFAASVSMALYRPVLSLRIGSLIIRGRIRPLTADEQLAVIDLYRRYFPDETHRMTLQPDMTLMRFDSL